MCIYQFLSDHNLYLAVDWFSSGNSLLLSAPFAQLIAAKFQRVENSLIMISVRINSLNSNQSAVTQKTNARKFEKLSCQKKKKGEEAKGQSKPKERNGRDGSRDSVGTGKRVFVYMLLLLLLYAPNQQQFAPRFAHYSSDCHAFILSVVFYLLITLSTTQQKKNRSTTTKPATNHSEMLAK